MKLIYCTACGDIYNLIYSDKQCRCGNTSGRYTGQGKNALIIGKTAIPLGIDNGSLDRAMKYRTFHGPGSRFVGFVIERKCSSIVARDQETQI